MKRKWKIILLLVLVSVVSGGIYASIQYNQRGIVTVQSGKVVKQDLAAVVTASGEIKPKNYINLGANTQGPGPLTGIYVKEGDHVHKGQVVAQIESTQAGADVVAGKAGISTALADSAASEAGMKAMEDSIRTAEAGLVRTKTELQRTKLNLDRYKRLMDDKLIARQDYDQKQAEYDTAVASVTEAETKIAQAKSQENQAREQLSSSQRRINQLQANLDRVSDILHKYSVVAPLDGIVTNLPVRTGETVVPGIQNSSSSTIMTIADMSLITAEIKVDETDIVSLKLDQKADIAIDAIPNKTFKGHVVEIGNTAILRSTGLAASQSAVSSQEAKDFKVVVALDNPPDEIRPGLSCTAKIITATRNAVASIPIQALTVRQKGDLEPKKLGVQAAPKLTPAQAKALKEEVQGVFVINAGKALFRKVETGISGATDIEVLSGIKEGDEIVTGSYKAIHTIANDTRVKVDNTSPVKPEAST